MTQDIQETGEALDVDPSDDELMSAAEGAIEAPVEADDPDTLDLSADNSDMVGDDEAEITDPEKDGEKTSEEDAAKADEDAKTEDTKDEDSSQKADDVTVDPDKAADAEAKTSEEDGEKEVEGDADTKDDPDPLTLTNEQLRGLKGPVRRSVRSMQEYIKTHQDGVTAYQEFQGFLSEQRIQPDDVSSTLTMLGALNRGDHQGFLDAAMPFITKAQMAMGQILPDDLNREVEEGYISVERAQELAQSRSQLATSQNNIQINAQQTQQQQTEAHAQGMADSVNAWEDEQRRSDPDYTDEFADVQRKFTQSLIAERGQPRDQQEALAWVKEANASAKAIFAPRAEKPGATRRKPSDIHASNNVRAEPTSIMEAALQGLETAQAS